MYSNSEACCGDTVVHLYKEAKSLDPDAALCSSTETWLRSSKVALPQDTRKIIDLLGLECL